MKTSSLVVLLLATFLSSCSKNTEDDSGAIIDLLGSNGFAGVESEGNWQWTDSSSLSLSQRAGETGWKRFNHYLWLQDSYADFRIELEYRLPAGGNSGLHFRVGDRSDPVNSGLELQLMDSSQKPDSKIGKMDDGSIFNLKKADTNASNTPGEWNNIAVSLIGSRLTAILNGEKIHDFDLKESMPSRMNLLESGSIGFQDAGTPFEIRNLRIESL